MVGMLQKFGILRDVIQTFHYNCLQKLLFDEAVASLIEIYNSILIEGPKMVAAIMFT